MRPGRICDLIDYWIMEGRDEKNAMKTRAMLEMPPPGYTGSLRNTVWDTDAMLADYGG